MTIRRSQLKTLDLIKNEGPFTVRQLAEREGVKIPSARSRLERLADHGWLSTKQVPGPTSPMGVYRINQQGRRALKRGLKEWADGGINALS